MGLREAGAGRVGSAGGRAQPARAGAPRARRAGGGPRTGAVRVVALAVMGLCAIASVALTALLASSSGRNSLVYTVRADESGTTEEALGVAAGAFRGLFLNWLWLRAQNLKQEGKFYESTDLAKTITRLQPRLPRVWTFHAWNLAYNISVAAQTAPERWNWVNQGIRLLRNEAIPRNPRDLFLHRELGWMFLHKVQGINDDANQYYKAKLAEEWTIALGDPPRRTKEHAGWERLSRLYAQEWLGPIAQSPADEGALRRQDPEAAELLGRLEAQTGLDTGTEADRTVVLRTVAQMQTNTRVADAFGQGSGLAFSPAQVRVAEFITAIPSQGRGARNRALDFLRRRQVTETHRMEPDLMIQYTERYGPLDWRHAGAHGVYWAARGVEQARAFYNANDQQNAKNFDFINTDRVVIQSLQELFRSGRVFFDINNPRFYKTYPSADFIHAYGGQLQAMVAREFSQVEAQRGVSIEHRLFNLFAAGYENFLSDAILYLYRANRLDEARRWQEVLATWPGRNLHDPTKERMRRLPLDDFYFENIRERLNNPFVALAEFGGALETAYIDGLLGEDQELYERNVEYAGFVHREFIESNIKGTSVDPNWSRVGTIEPEFEHAAGRVLGEIVLALGPIDGAILYSRAPLAYHLGAYRLIASQRPVGDISDLSQVPEEVRALIRLFDARFPKPAGFDEFYQQWRRTFEDDRLAPIELK